VVLPKRSERGSWWRSTPWFHLAAPELRRRAERSATRANTTTPMLSDDDARRRGEAIGLLRSLSSVRLFGLVEQIATTDTKRAAQVGASTEQQEAVRRRWLENAELLQEAAEMLEKKLRAPLGVPFPRTLKEWNSFEQAFIARLRSQGFSYGEITRICRPGTQAAGATAPKARVERERVRGSARRARARQ
jgi:hypothetical protein